VVFPRVQQRYQEVGYSLELVDPRLHAASEEDAEGLGTLERSLDDVESCRPHFLCLLGSNYGKVILEVPDAIGRKHPAVRHFFRISRVHLETMTSVLRDPGRAEHSFFYFRKPDFLTDVAEYDKPTYVPNNKMEALNEIEAHKLEIFKEAIQRTGRPVRSYGCTYDSAAQTITGLDDLGAKIEHDLLTIVGLAEPLAVEDTVPGSMVTEEAAGVVAGIAAGAAIGAVAMEATMPVDEAPVAEEPVAEDPFAEAPVEAEPDMGIAASAGAPNVSLLSKSVLGDESAASLEMPMPMQDAGAAAAFNDDAAIDEIVAEVTDQPEVISDEETVISEQVIDDASAEQAAGEVFGSDQVVEDAFADQLLSDNNQDAEAAAMEVFATGDEVAPADPNAPSFEVAPGAMAEMGSSFDFSDNAVAPEPVEVVEEEEEAPKKKKKKKKK
jgi:hypothetical protein